MAALIVLAVIAAGTTWTAVGSWRLRRVVRRYLEATGHHHGVHHLSAQDIDSVAAPVYPPELLRNGRLPSVWRPGSPLRQRLR
jgi:hypothetical protein